MKIIFRLNLACLSSALIQSEDDNMALALSATCVWKNTKGTTYLILISSIRLISIDELNIQKAKVVSLMSRPQKTV